MIARLFCSLLSLLSFSFFENEVVALIAKGVDPKRAPPILPWHKISTIHYPTHRRGSKYCLNLKLIGY